jgi:hypothetical protein
MGGMPDFFFENPIPAVFARKYGGRHILTGGERMVDLDKYIEARKKKRPDFAKNFEIGYE